MACRERDCTCCSCETLQYCRRYGHDVAPPGKRAKQARRLRIPMSHRTVRRWPGFFVLPDERQSLRPTMSYRSGSTPQLVFEREGVPRDALTVLDQARFARFLQEASGLSQ